MTKLIAFIFLLSMNVQASTGVDCESLFARESSSMAGLPNIEDIKTELLIELSLLGLDLDKVQSLSARTGLNPNQIHSFREAVVNEIKSNRTPTAQAGDTKQILKLKATVLSIQMGIAKIWDRHRVDQDLYTQIVTTFLLTTDPPSVLEYARATGMTPRNVYHKIRWIEHMLPRFSKEELKGLRFRRVLIVPEDSAKWPGP